MGRKTREMKDRSGRTEEIEQHVAWATLQDPVVRTIAAYTDGCAVYGPTPKGEWKPGYNYHKVDELMLVPEACDVEVVIPAGWRKMIAVVHHRKVIGVTYGDPDAGGIRNEYLLEFGEGLVARLPGGGTARLVKDDNGYRFVEDEEKKSE